MNGEYRWVLVNSEGSITRRIHYPSKRQALMFAFAGETAKCVRVVKKAGPFSDHVIDAENMP